MQYCSLQHWTLLLSPVTSTTGYCFCFGSIPSVFLELFLHWYPVAYWAVPLSVSYHFAFSYCSWGSQGKNRLVWNEQNLYPFFATDRVALFQEVLLDVYNSKSIRTSSMAKSRRSFLPKILNSKFWLIVLFIVTPYLISSFLKLLFSCDYLLIALNKTQCKSLLSFSPRATDSVSLLFVF